MRTYKLRGQETWALIREERLNGASVKRLARRYDVTEDAIWKRHQREGWSPRARARREPPGAAAAATSPVTAADETTDAGDLAR